MAFMASDKASPASEVSAKGRVENRCGPFSFRGQFCLRHDTRHESADTPSGSAAALGYGWSASITEVNLPSIP